MINVTTNGKDFIATLLKETQMHLAWGTGDDTWTDSDKSRAQTIELADLTSEIARRSVVITGFAAPDTSGAIEFDGVKYAVSTTPTNYVYLKCVFKASENSNDVIRELGLFVNCHTATSLPAGQQYFTPLEVTAKGQLFAISRLTNPIQRANDTKQIFEFVIPVVQ